MGLTDKLKKIGKVGVIAATSFIPFSYVKGAQEFIRGDVDRDGKITITDSVKTLNYLFKGGGKIECEDAADLDDDGKIDLGDAVYGLGYLFQGKQEPAKPFPGRGYDETSDNLSCMGLEKILYNSDFAGASFKISRKGTADNPLIYVLGEEITAPESGFIIKNSEHVNIDCRNHKLEYGQRNRYGARGIKIINSNHIKVIDLNLFEFNPLSNRTAIELDNAHHCIFSNIAVSTFGEYSSAVSLSQSSFNQFSDFEIMVEGVASGVTVSSSENNTFQRINIDKKNKLSGIYIAASNDNNFSEIFLHSFYDGLYIIGNATNNRFFSSWIESSDLANDVQFASILPEFISQGDLLFFDVYSPRNKISFKNAVAHSDANLLVHWNFYAFVKNQNGNLLNAKIRLYDKGGQLRRDLLTGDDGKLETSLLSYRQNKEGYFLFYPYTAEVSAEGYKTEKRTFSLIDNTNEKFVLLKE